MINIIAYTLALWTLIQSGTPTLDGLATHYDEPGSVFRAGEAFLATAQVGAVDDGRWPELENRLLLVQSTYDEKWTVLCIRDTGYLVRVGGEWVQSKWSWKYWVRPGDVNALVGSDVEQMVIDIPIGTYLRTFGDLETRHIRAWIID